MPEDLPRVERLIVCTSEQCICAHCGEQRAVIGYDESEQLDHEPAKYFVLKTRREKRACKSCEQDGVVAAPLAEQIVAKSLVSDRIVIDTVLNKYVAHLSLYRQSALLERDSGIEVSRATVDGWVMRVGELLAPLVSAMRKEILAGSYIQADETPVAVQKHDGSGTNHQAYLWQYGTPRGSVVFDFRMGRAREGPRFLYQYEGLLQTDGYAAYDGVGGKQVVHAACWSHARRKFTDALKLNPKDEAAMRLLARIDALFVVCPLPSTGPRRRRTSCRPTAGSHALLEAMRAELKTTVLDCLPSSATAKAANYTLALWHKLTRFSRTPGAGAIQQSCRELYALHRSRTQKLDTSGPSDCGTQDRGHPLRTRILPAIKINPRHYLTVILPGLASKSIQQLHTLTPKTSRKVVCSDGDLKLAAASLNVNPCSKTFFASCSRPNTVVGHSGDSPSDLLSRKSLRKLSFPVLDQMDKLQNLTPGFTVCSRRNYS